MILTIGKHVITRIPRFNVIHDSHHTWTLQIKDVQAEDKGYYMCQVNTDPMRSRRAYLEVQVPPFIIDSRTTNDLIVREAERVNLSCEARGYPEPQLLWRREDGKHIYNEYGEKGIFPSY